MSEKLLANSEETNDVAEITDPATEQTADESASAETTEEASE